MTDVDIKKIFQDASNSVRTASTSYSEALTTISNASQGSRRDIGQSGAWSPQVAQPQTYTPPSYGYGYGYSSDPYGNQQNVDPSAGYAHPTYGKVGR